MATEERKERRRKNKVSLHDCLMKKMKGKTVRYIKAKNISQDLDMSNKEVGTMMGALERNSSDLLKVERWGYSTSTTWRVTWR